MKISDYDLSKTEWINLIDEWILSDRDRRILKRRILDGIKHEALAEEFDLSVQRIKKIIEDSRTILERHMSDEKKTFAYQKMGERRTKK